MEHFAASALDAQFETDLQQIELASWNRARSSHELSQFVLQRHELLGFDEEVDSLLAV